MNAGYRKPKTTSLKFFGLSKERYLNGKVAKVEIREWVCLPGNEVSNTSGHSNLALRIL